MISTISVVEAQLKTALAGLITDWPIRWPNEVWPRSVPLNEGNLPIETDGRPKPYVQAEVIGGADVPAIGPRQGLHSQRHGLFRVYLVVGQGAGLANITDKSDAIANHFKLLDVYLDPTTGTRLSTRDVRVDDGVAGHEDGNRFVRQCSMDWILDYFS